MMAGVLMRYDVILKRRPQDAHDIELRKKSEIVEDTLSLEQSVLNFLAKTQGPEGWLKTSRNDSNKTLPA